jgi:hypothetical protein
MNEPTLMGFTLAVVEMAMGAVALHEDDDIKRC